MSGTFQSLRARNYRLFAGGQLISLTGTWMQRTGQDWLVVSRLAPHSRGTAAGITMGLQFLPVLLFGLQGGLIADRFSKRTLLIITQIAMGLIALTLGSLVAADAVTLHEVYLLAFLLGLTTAVDNPARQSFVSELVGPDAITNAVSLNSATFNGARLVGPAIGGLMIESVGIAWVFFANALSFIAVLTGLFCMRTSELHVAKRLVRAKGQVREGLRYIAKRPDLLVPIGLVAVVGMLGFNFQITLALADKTVFNKGAAGYGLLSSLLAIGSLGGAIYGARRGRPTKVFLLGTAACFGALELGCAFMPSYAAFGALLVPTGLSSIAMSTAANSMVQLNTEPLFRGRVLALYMIVFAGTTPIGAPLVGYISQHLGVRFGIGLGGAASLAAAIVVALVWRATRTARANALLPQLVEASLEEEGGGLTRRAG